MSRVRNIGGVICAGLLTLPTTGCTRTTITNLSRDAAGVVTKQLSKDAFKTGIQPSADEIEVACTKYLNDNAPEIYKQLNYLFHVPTKADRDAIIKDCGDITKQTLYVQG